MDLMACDTDDRVARRRQEGAMGEGVTVGPPEDVKRSDLRCSIVVVVGGMFFVARRMFFVA